MDMDPEKLEKLVTAFKMANTRVSIDRDIIRAGIRAILAAPERTEIEGTKLHEEYRRGYHAGRKSGERNARREDAGTYTSDPYKLGLSHGIRKAIDILKEASEG